MLALEVVCRSLNIKIRMLKTPRCSGRGEVIADLLSKGKVGAAVSMMGSTKMVEVPRTLLKYLRRPSKSCLLGHAILEEISRVTEILPPEPEFSFELEDLRW